MPNENAKTVTLPEQTAGKLPGAAVEHLPENVVALASISLATVPELPLGVPEGIRGAASKVPSLDSLMDSPPGGPDIPESNPVLPAVQAPVINVLFGESELLGIAPFLHHDFG